LTRTDADGTGGTIWGIGETIRGTTAFVAGDEEKVDQLIPPERDGV
jgi:hypothetical protein